MNNIIETMLSKYNIQNNGDKENAIKEIIQEIALSGLSHGDFFKKAVFYGGTCLRIFHGLNRFSEDLDFALKEKDCDFKLDEYFPYLEKEFSSYGLQISIESKKKSKETEVQSAFLKGNTLMLMISFFPKDEEQMHFNPEQKIKIKFEIDIDNVSGGTTEIRYSMLPSPYEIEVYDESTLFAGKIHAILCRKYRNNVKGRDYYDYLFYIGKGANINLEYLENKLKNTGGILGADEKLSLDKVKELLTYKFKTVDYESAKADVSNFVEDKECLKIWKADLFLSTLDKLKAK